MSKKTGWFQCPGDEGVGVTALRGNPVRVGWYEGKCHHAAVPADSRIYWNGSVWSNQKSGPTHRSGVSFFGQCCDSWRGLSAPPSAE